MPRPRIAVIGSSNIDMVVKCDRIPRGGETVLGGDFVMVPGGKGANQAVCAAKLGADVTLVARVGDDVFGDMSLENLRAAGIDTTFVKRDANAPSGIALIAVDAGGENAIVVAPGANDALTPSDVDAAREVIAASDTVILQFESPAESVVRAIDIARSLGVRVVLNPAPIRPFPREAIGKVDILVPNQHEAADLVGKAGSGADLDAETAAAELLNCGVSAVLITLGSRGAYLADGGTAEFIDPVKVTAVDTTAAGDAFTASLAYCLSEGKDLVSSAKFAARVAGIVVTRMGAQSSMPTRSEVESFDLGNQVRAKPAVL